MYNIILFILYLIYDENLYLTIFDKWNKNVYKYISFFS